jgi:hypothetical protein
MAAKLELMGSRLNSEKLSLVLSGLLILLEKVCGSFKNCDLDI